MNTLHARMKRLLESSETIWTNGLLDLRPMPDFGGFRHAGNVVAASKREREGGERRTPNTQRRRLINRGCNLTVHPRVIYNGITEMAARLGEEWLCRHLQKVGLVAAAVAFVGNCG